MICYLIVHKAENAVSERVKLRCPFLVAFLFRFFIMLAAVKFNDKSMLCAIEISNIVSKYFLPLKFCRVRSQKVIPKVPFFFCHILPKISRICHKLGIVQSLVAVCFHIFPPTQSASLPAPPPCGGAFSQRYEKLQSLSRSSGAFRSFCERIGFSTPHATPISGSSKRIERS